MNYTQHLYEIIRLSKKYYFIIWIKKNFKKNNSFKKPLLTSLKNLIYNN